jgi:hypothetical protein
MFSFFSHLNHVAIKLKTFYYSLKTIFLLLSPLTIHFFHFCFLPIIILSEIRSFERVCLHGGMEKSWKKNSPICNSGTHQCSIGTLLVVVLLAILPPPTDSIQQSTCKSLVIAVGHNVTTFFG